MPSDDPLITLLHAADSAAATPTPPTDLIARVHQRRDRQAFQARRVRLGAISLAAVIALVATFLSTSKPPVRLEDGAPMDRPLAQNHRAEPGAKLAVADLNRLTAEAAALKAEGDALEKCIAAHERAKRLESLVAEQDRLIVALSAPDTAIAAVDRAAGSAVCQADFILEILGDRHAAETAYRNIVEQFPDTHWAMIASDNLSRLEMN